MNKRKGIFLPSLSVHKTSSPRNLQPGRHHFHGIVSLKPDLLWTEGDGLEPENLGPGFPSCMLEFLMWPAQFRSVTQSCPTL